MHNIYYNNTIYKLLSFVIILSLLCQNIGLAEHISTPQNIAPESIFQHFDQYFNIKGITLPFDIKEQIFMGFLKISERIFPLVPSKEEELLQRDALSKEISAAFNLIDQNYSNYIRFDPASIQTPSEDGNKFFSIGVAITSPEGTSISKQIIFYDPLRPPLRFLQKNCATWTRNDEKYAREWGFWIINTAISTEHSAEPSLTQETHKKDKPKAIAPTKNKIDYKKWFTMSTIAIAAGYIFYFFGLPFIQFLLSGNNFGSDFWIYNRGSLTLFDHGLDPYSKGNILSTFGKGSSALENGNIYIFTNWRDEGYIGSPFNLLLFYPLSRFLSYTTSFYVYLTTNIAMIAATITLFSLKLMKNLTKFEKGFYTIILNVIFLTMFYPAMVSITFGQLDPIYFFIMAMAIYLFVFHKDKRWTLPAVGIGIALAAGIKLFPVILLVYFLCNTRIRKQNAETDASVIQSNNTNKKILKWSLLTIVGVFLATVIAIGPDIFESWISKLPMLSEQGIYARVKPSLLVYCKFLPFWLSQTSGGFLFNIIVPSIYMFLAIVYTYVYTKSQDHKNVLPKITLFIALAPILMPHWSNYYSTVMILPIIVTFFYAKQLKNKFVKIATVTLLTLGFLFSNEFILVILDVFGRHYPAIGEWLTNQNKCVEILSDYLINPGKLPHGMTFLGATRYIMGITPSPINFLFGFPGLLMIFLSNLMVLTELSKQKQSGGDGFIQSEKGKAPEELKKIRTEQRENLTKVSLPQFEQIKEYIQNKITALEEKIRKTEDKREKKQLEGYLAIAKEGFILLQKLYKSGNIYSFKGIVYGKEDYALGFGDGSELEIAEEFLDIPLELLAELLFHEAVCYKIQHWKAKWLQQELLKENYISIDRQLKTILREFINKKSRTRNGIDPFDTLRTVLGDTKNIEPAYFDESDYNSQRNYWSDQLKKVIKAGKHYAFTGDIKFYHTFSYALFSGDSYSSSELSLEQLEGVFKVVIHPQHGVIGISGIPEELSEKIKTMIPEGETKIIDLVPLFILIDLYKSGYPDIERIIEGLIKENKIDVSYENFVEFIQCYQQHEQAPEKILEEMRQIDSRDQEHLTELYFQKRELEMKLNFEVTEFARLLNFIPDEQLETFLRKIVIKSQDITEKTLIEILDKFIKAPTDDQNKFKKLTELAWKIYLNPNNTSSENELFRTFLSCVIDITDEGSKNALRKIQKIFETNNLNECYLAIDILLRLEIRKENMNNLFSLLQQVPYKKQVIAAYCLANITLRGVEEEAPSREFGRLNPVFYLLQPESRYMYFYILRIQEARNRGGAMNPEVDHRIIHYTIALDNYAGAPGIEGHSWFTYLRSSVHKNASSYDLQVVRKLLHHWKDKHMQHVDSAYRTLITAIPDSFSGDTLDNYSEILNRALTRLYSEGYIKNLEGAAFLDEFNSIDEETVIEAVKQAGEELIQEKFKDEEDKWRKKDFEHILEDVGNTIRLSYALTEKYGVVAATIIPKIKGGDKGDSWEKRKMTARIEFMRSDYDALINVIDSDNAHLVLAHVAQCRLMIRDHLLYDKIESTDEEEDDEVKNKLLDLDYNLYLFGKEKVIDILRDIEQCQTLENLKKYIYSLAAIGKFFLASGMGGVEFEQLVTELEKDTLTYSQIHDLIRALRSEVHKITRNINESIRSATEYIWDKLEYDELTEEWQKGAKTKKIQTKWNYEKTVLTEEGQEQIINNMVDTLIRDTQILSFDQMLMRFNEILETQLTPVNDAIAVERKNPEGLPLSDQFFRFGQPEIIPRDKLLSLWSKKGLNLVEMTENKMQVPPGVIISSRLVTRPDIFKSAEFRAEVEKEVALIRKYSKYPDLKFLLYARSGSAFTLPGLLITIPNLGMNDKEAADLAKKTGDVWFAYDTYAEFIRSYAIYILGIPEEYFQDILNVYKKDELSGENMKGVVERYKKLVIEKYPLTHPSPLGGEDVQSTGEGAQSLAFHDIIPEAMIDQVMLAIDAVYASWDSDDARAYRERHRISQEWGTVVILQKGIFGNLDVTADGRISGTGFGILRALPGGREIVQGKFRFRAHGDQLMSRADQNYVLLSNSQRLGNEQTLEDLQPELYEQLLKRAHEIKDIFGNNQQFEFVIELNNLWITQSNDDYVTDEYPEFANPEEYELIGRGHGVSAGAFRGWVANSLEKARELIEKYNREKPDNIDGVVLFLNRVNPEFINLIPKGVAICAKIISVHAETLAQKGGIPSVYGVAGMEYNEAEGTWYINGRKMEDGMLISIDGHENQLVYHNSGKIFLGSVPLAKISDGTTEVERRTPRALDLIRELRKQELIDEAMASQKLSLTNFEKEILTAFEKCLHGELQKSTIDRYRVIYGTILDKIALFCKDLDFTLYGEDFKKVLTDRLAEWGIKFDTFVELHKMYYPRGRKAKKTFAEIDSRLSYKPPEITYPQQITVFSTDGTQGTLTQDDIFSGRSPFSGNAYIIHPLKKPVKLVSFEFDDVLERFLGPNFTNMLDLFKRLKALGLKVAITTTNPYIPRWFHDLKSTFSELVDYCECDTSINLTRYETQLGIKKDEIIHFGNWWAGFESSYAADLHKQGFISVFIGKGKYGPNTEDIMNRNIDAVITGRLTIKNIIDIVESYRWGKESATPISSTLKDIGPALDEAVLRELEQKKPDWEKLVLDGNYTSYAKPIKPLRGVPVEANAKIIQVNNLPPGVNAWPFREDEKKPASPLIIVTRAPPENIPYLDELVYHEYREDDWISKGLPAHDAHILAAYEEVIGFAKDGELTAYHKQQLEGMSIAQLFYIMNEYASGSRSTNYILYRKRLGKKWMSFIKAYESRIIKSARKFHKEKTKNPEYIFSEKMTQKIQSLEKDIGRVRNSLLKPEQCSLEFPAHIDQSPMVTASFVGAQAKTIRLLITEEICAIFKFHNINKIVFETDCPIDLFSIIAYLAWLANNSIVLGERDGFYSDSNHACTRKGTVLKLDKKNVSTPKKVWEVAFRKTEQFKSKKLIENVLRKARKYIDNNDITSAKRILEEIKDKIYQKGIDAELCTEYDVLLEEIHKWLLAVLDMVTQLINGSKPREASEIILKLYNDFKDNPEFIEIAASIEDKLPIEFRMKIARDQGQIDKALDLFHRLNGQMNSAPANKRSKLEAIISAFIAETIQSIEQLIKTGNFKEAVNLIMLYYNDFENEQNFQKIIEIAAMESRLPKPLQFQILLQRAKSQNIGEALRSILLFRNRCRKDPKIKLVLRKFFIKILTEYGGNIPHCIKITHISANTFRGWLSKLGIDADKLVYHEDKRLREYINKKKQEEIEAKGPLEGRKVTEIQCFNLIVAFKALGWPNSSEFAAKHLNNKKVQKVLKDIFEEVLQLTFNNTGFATELLGIGSATFYKWIKDLGISITSSKGTNQQAGTIADRLREALQNLPEGQRERLDLATAALGYSGGNPKTSLKEFTKKHGRDTVVRKVMKETIIRALIGQGGTKSAAQRRLGITEVCLAKYIKILNINEATLPYDELGRFKAACEKCIGIPNIPEIVKSLGYSRVETFLSKTNSDPKILQYMSELAQKALEITDSAKLAAEKLGIGLSFYYRLLKYPKTSGALKDLGPALDEKTLSKLKQKEPDWRKLLLSPQNYTTYAKPIKPLRGVPVEANAKIIHVNNLPARVNAWHFREDEGNPQSPLVIVIRAPPSTSPSPLRGEGIGDKNGGTSVLSPEGRGMGEGDYLDELVYHEYREDYWISQGLSLHDAHILAAYEEVIGFEQEDKLTTYHRLQLKEKNMTIERLKAIIEEYNEGRNYHYDLALQNLGGEVVRQIKKYELKLVKEAERLMTVKLKEERMKRNESVIFSVQIDDKVLVQYTKEEYEKLVSNMAVRRGHLNFESGVNKEKRMTHPEVPGLKILDYMFILQKRENSEEKPGNAYWDIRENTPATVILENNSIALIDMENAPVDLMAGIKVFKAEHLIILKGIFRGRETIMIANAGRFLRHDPSSVYNFLPEWMEKNDFKPQHIVYVSTSDSEYDCGQYKANKYICSLYSCILAGPRGFGFQDEKTGRIEAHAWEEGLPLQKVFENTKTENKEKALSSMLKNAVCRLIFEYCRQKGDMRLTSGTLEKIYEDIRGNEMFQFLKNMFLNNRESEVLEKIGKHGESWYLDKIDTMRYYELWENIFQVFLAQCVMKNIHPYIKSDENEGDIIRSLYWGFCSCLHKHYQGLNPFIKYILDELKEKKLIKDVVLDFAKTANGSAFHENNYSGIGDYDSYACVQDFFPDYTTFPFVMLQHYCSLLGIVGGYGWNRSPLLSNYCREGWDGLVAAEYLRDTEGNRSRKEIFQSVAGMVKKYGFEPFIKIVLRTGTYSELILKFLGAYSGYIENADQLDPDIQDSVVRRLIELKVITGHAESLGFILSNPFILRKSMEMSSVNFRDTIQSLVSFKEIFETNNRKLDEERQYDEDLFYKQYMPLAYMLEIILPGSLHYMCALLSSGSHPKTVVRFLESKKGALLNENIAMLFVSFLEKMKNIQLRRKIKIDLTMMFKVMDTGSGFAGIGCEGKFVEILVDMMEKSDGQISGSYASKMLMEQFFIKLGESLGIKDAVFKTSVYKKIYIPFINRLIEAKKHIEARANHKLPRFIGLLKAMFEDRFWDFIENEKQTDKTGRSIAIHNKKVREEIISAGIDVSRWLGKEKEKRMDDSEFMYHEISSSEYDPVGDVHTVIDYLKNVYALKELENKQKEQIINFLNSIGVIVEFDSSRKINKLKTDKSGKKKDIVGIFSDPENLSKLSSLISKMLQSDNVRNIPHVLEIVTHVNERINTLIQRLGIDSYKEDLGKLRKYFSVRPILKNPGHDLFLGDFTNCCLAMNSSSYPEAIVDRLIDEGMNVIETIDESTGETMACLWLYIAEDGNLVIQNIEVNAKYEKIKPLMDNIAEGMINYACKFADYIGAKGLLIGMPGHGKYFGYGGFIDERYGKNKVTFKKEKIGGYLGEKYYLDSAGKEMAYLVWANPHFGKNAKSGTLKDIISALEETVQQSHELSREFTHASEEAQKIHNITKLQCAVPLEVLRNSADFTLALKKMGNLGKGNTIFELVIYDLDTPIDGDQFIKLLNLPPNITNIRVYSVTKSETEGSNDIMRIKQVIQTRYPLEKNDHLIIITPLLENAGKAEEERKKLEELKELKQQLTQAKNISIGLAVKPGEQTVLSLSKILAEVLSGIGREPVKIILPVSISPQELKQRLNEDLEALWEFLKSA